MISIPLSTISTIQTSLLTMGCLVARTDFIKEHPQSLVSLYILYREYVSRLSSDDIQRNLSLVDPSLQQHRFAKILRDVINTREKTDIGQQAPDFSALTPEGTRVSLHDFLGRGYLLLDFWASWCGPCRKENPNVVTAYHDYKERGFDILAVSLDKNRDAWLKGIQQDQLPYHHVSELKYWDSDIARLYGIRSIPSNLLIDKNGKIVAKNLRDSDLRETLHALLDNRQVPERRYLPMSATKPISARRPPCWPPTLSAAGLLCRLTKTRPFVI